MELFIPPELQKEELAIKRFFEAMIYKLRKNAKTKPGFDATGVERAMQLLHGEVDELKTAIAENNSVEILLESADVANFALIAATCAIERGIKGKGAPGDQIIMKHKDIRT